MNGPTTQDDATTRGAVPRAVLVVLALVVLTAGTALGVGLGGGGTGSTGAVALADAELPAEDAALAAELRSFLSRPVQVQHRTFTRDRTEPVVTGIGFVDLSQGCRFDVTYTGSLYQVEMRSDGRQLWTRSTKRETGSQSLWEYALPLTTNLNAPVFALAGNPTLLHCNLAAIARSLRAAEGGYRVDPEALVSLLAAQRQQELNAVVVLAGADPAEAAVSLERAMVAATDLPTLIESVTVETDNRATMRITVRGDGGRVLDELLMRQVAAADFPLPEPVEPRGDQRAQARLLLGLDPR